MAALERKELRARGMSEEHIDEIMAIYGQEKANLQTRITTLETENGTLRAANDTLTTEKGAILTQNEELADKLTSAEAATSGAGDSELQQKYDALTAELLKLKLTAGVKEQLTKFNPLDTDLILSILDLSDVTPDDQGAFPDISDRIKAVKDQKPFLFAADERRKGSAGGSVPPLGGAGANGEGGADPKSIRAQLAKRDAEAKANMQKGLAYYMRGVPPTNE